MIYYPALKYFRNEHSQEHNHICFFDKQKFILTFKIN